MPGSHRCRRLLPTRQAAAQSRPESHRQSSCPKQQLLCFRGLGHAGVGSVPEGANGTGGLRVTSYSLTNAYRAALKYPRVPWLAAPFHHSWVNSIPRGPPSRASSGHRPSLLTGSELKSTTSHRCSTGPTRCEAQCLAASF